jgi:transposase
MRGTDRRTGELFSYVDLESRVRTDHPLRKIREVVNATLLAMSADFAGLYSSLGRPGIPPERLLRALLLQCFYSVRSERQLIPPPQSFLRHPRRPIEPGWRCLDG